MATISQPAPAREHKRRVPFWDNARFACIVLVVLGHALQRLTYDSDAALSLYLVVYAFHMPAFAVISGYFSKGGQQSKRQMSRVITDILVPYVIFESLWTLTKWLVEGRANPNPTEPSWTLWFLLALGIFRLLLPYIALLKWPLLWTIGISIAAGYMSNIDSTLSLSRTLGLLPFFTLGWWLNEHDLVRKLRLLRHRQWWLPAASIVVFATAGWVTWTFAGTWRDVNLREWLFYDEDYSSLGITEWWAGGVRLGLMAVAILLMTAFFVLIPRDTHRWTRYGQYTMYVYLLHSFVLYPLRESGVLRGLEPSWIWLPTVAIASVGIAVGLSSAPVRKVFRPIVEPRPKWLFADTAWTRSNGHDNDPTGSRRDADAAPGKERPQP
ncbi:fucose 4-O-acetylase-like acetyltransferase [Microbacterium halimionae]|uniref:Fucose 4-O-acetylase-like acetyltransferase n=1 Tax=Microbacterium halimionae TaxID=1526413 RepID=A0A7W3JP72_9MICO|nr:acyltransferase family protein [Microbacterium halimionae]MBA8816471.1 fucose 4-O-acetylase-like acetyltransferase [Microbacterium halimionae]NII95342.1 fucose 4-O-acetylase-like acetyltransferase [Microbacterium halimionae]